MIWQIIAHSDRTDAFEPKINPQSFRIDLNHNPNDGDLSINSNIGRVFDSYGGYPSDLAIDLLNLAITVFTSDKCASRGQAYDRWTRGFQIFQPVSDLAIWNRVRQKLETMLGFLTGDHWEIEFREVRNRPPISSKQSQMNLSHLARHPGAIALLSGGLDSFSGAIDILESIPGEVVFVSHYNRGGPTKMVQDRVYAVLDRNYPGRVCPLQFFIQPPEKITGGNDRSLRSRSFLFLALGIAASNANTENPPLYIYENGLLSLNVPLMSNRSGSLSTRTTHPHFMNLYQDFLDEVGLSIHIETPFRFKTKGEILLGSKNMGVLKEGITGTHSCSQPTYLQFKGLGQGNHCGHCLPCIVRRAATTRAGLSDVKYEMDIRKDNPPSNQAEGKDLFAIKTALRRLETLDSPLIFYILNSAPLPGTKADLDQYVDVYRRGMEELGNFLK
jgi:hypothetical protein